MRILYIDIDSLRPDHLGCYGYHRNTSPNIDKIAAQGVRFDNLYTSDAPCLPSRTALISGRFGIHNGVINHGGVAGEPFIEGPGRGFGSRLGATSWMRCLRLQGYHTASISPFPERHAAWQWTANFNEMHNTGGFGMERADEIAPVALDWIEHHGSGDNWFLHVNVWDPHTPYRTPLEYDEPFANEPGPDWLTDDVRKDHWSRPGPHSAQEIGGFYPTPDPKYPRQPVTADSMKEVRRMFDGYDTGIRYADDYVGRFLAAIADHGVLDDTVIMIGADHGENLGELNIYGDHRTADYYTSRVPLIVRWPEVTDSTPGRLDSALHYHFDFAATMVELTGGKVPAIWDGRSFADAFRKGEQSGREYLVLSQGAWTCQRSVRWGDYLCIRSYHDGYNGFPDVMLYDLKNDPHEQNDLASREPALTNAAFAMLDQWYGEMMRAATHGQDPMWTVMLEGGPAHTRGELPRYLERLRQTGRADWAGKLAASHPRELGTEWFSAPVG